MNDNDIAQLVRASLEAKIVAAFRETPEMIDELVKACLTEPVTSRGAVPRYGEGEMPYLTYLAQDTIRSVARSVVIDCIEDMRPQITEQVQAELSKVSLAEAFTKSLMHIVEEEWRISVRFESDN